MTKKTMTIRDAKGIHMTVAEKIATKASETDCHIWLNIRGIELEADNFLGLLGHHAQHGEEITVFAEGPGEEAAVDAIAGIVTT